MWKVLLGILCRALTISHAVADGLLVQHLSGTSGPIGEREFDGFQIYHLDNPDIRGLTDTCQIVITQTKCNGILRIYQMPTPPMPRRILRNPTPLDEICDAGCGRSLRSYYETVMAACEGQRMGGRKVAGLRSPERAGGTVWTAYNETCLRDPVSGDYCNGIVTLFLRFTISILFLRCGPSDAEY
jgi:hypothetical protein